MPSPEPAVPAHGGRPTPGRRPPQHPHRRARPALAAARVAFPAGVLAAVLDLWTFHVGLSFGGR
jgi:hypothetical protein